MKILVTGAAGFIGYHVAEYLLGRGDDVVGVDNMNNYYDVSLKEARLARLLPHSRFRFTRLDLADRNEITELFARERFARVVHLGAQAGVRYSLTNPHAYVDSNLIGFVNVLEGCRQTEVEHFVYASSSSVYGANTAMPFSEHEGVDHPLSLYAATKKANELMAHSYSHLYALPTTGLRFFTVYGPWGRPDMAVFLYTKAVFEGRPIDVFNYGKMRRDFTYIDDIVEGVVRVLDRPPQPSPALTGASIDPATSASPYRIYNIGNKTPVELLKMIEIIEQSVGRPAIRRMLDMQPGDVLATCADTTDLEAAVGFSPTTPLAEGIHRFVKWYAAFYNVSSRKAPAVADRAPRASVREAMPGLSNA